MAQPNVIVIGAGVWGLSCAYQLACAGASVVVLEADRVGCGASGGIVGAMAPYVPDSWSAKKLFQLEALVSAAAFWAKVEQDANMPTGYGQIGRVVPITDTREQGLADVRIKDAQRFWPHPFEWRVAAGHSLLAPKFAPLGVTVDTLSARIYPKWAVAALAQACRARGVEILEDWPVEDVQSRRVFGPAGHRDADAIVIAGGVGGFDLMSGYFGKPAGSGVKGQAAVLGVDLGDAPQIYAGGVYVIPHADGTTAVGSTAESDYADARTTDVQLDDVIARARAVCPALHAAPIVSRWAGVRPKARRRDPMLGPVPDMPGVFAALGGYMIGFGLANKVGAVLTGMVNGRDVDVPRNFTVDWHMG